MPTSLANTCKTNRKRKKSKCGPAWHGPHCCQIQSGSDNSRSFAATSFAMISQIFEQAYHELRPRAPMPEFEVRFYRFANINNTIRLRQGRILLRLSDLLEGAPEPVLYAILHILIAKLYRKPNDPAHAARYRKFTGSRAMTEKTHLIRQMRGRKRIEGPQGRQDRKSTRLNSSHSQ